MSRSVIGKLFYGSLIAIVVGLVLLGTAIAFAIGSGSFMMNGPDVVGIQSAFGWGMIALGVVAILVLIAASIAQFVAWIGALINTAALENKTWFVVLLVTGILGFGIITMLIYLLSETDEPRTELRPESRTGAA